MININGLPDPIINYDFEKVYTPSDDSYLIIDYFKKNINYNYFDGRKIITLEEAAKYVSEVDSKRFTRSVKKKNRSMYDQNRNFFRG